jgi:uncharacterized membrane protein YphA (DoxX/SURF4 family)
VALLLLIAGVHKAADPGRVHAAIAAYRIVPASIEQPVMWLVIGIEITVGAALMIPVTRQSASLAAATVFAVYFAVMASSLVRGHRRVDCGCSLNRRETPLSGFHLIRNGLLVAIALVASGSDVGGAVSWLDAVQITAAVVSLALIYMSADLLMANQANVARREA